MKTKWFEKICRGILLCLGILSLGGILSFIHTPRVSALDNQTYDTDFFEQHYSSMTTSVTSATHSVVGMGTSFALYISTPNATGAGAIFQVMYSTYTTKPDLSGQFTQGGQVFMSTSTPIFIPANVYWPVKLWMEAPNPKIVVSGLSAAATAHIKIDYGTPRLNH